jgi:DNA polymerase III alpha subunit
MLDKFRSRDSKNLKSLLMEALLLDGQVEEAKKVLALLPQEAEVGKRVALSGALARSVEYYIDNGEFEEAADQWDQWQRRFPDSFFEGYSALLKVRMMEKASPVAAAKVAEAFALAVPDSPYAPQLLDRASAILAKLDKSKSDALRKLLKEKYPEDPLSQDKAAGK